MPAVSRIEVAETLRAAFTPSGADRNELLAAALSKRARPEVVAVIEQLPDRHFRAMNELWEHIGHVPVEV